MDSRIPLLFTTFVTLTATAELPAQTFLDTIADREFAGPQFVSVYHSPGGIYRCRVLAPSPAQIRFFQDSNQTATVTLPSGSEVRDCTPADVNNDGNMDLVVLTHDPQGNSQGSVRFYLDVQADQNVDHVVNQLAPGTHPFTRGTITTVQPTPGSADHILIGDRDYSVGNQTREGFVVSLSVTTGTPAINWGWLGAYPGAELGAAVAARNADPSAGGVYIFTEPGRQGAGGDEGHLWVADPITGGIWWGVPGQPGSKIGTRAAINGDWAFTSNPEGNNDALNEIDNGAALQIHLGTTNGSLRFGAPGEHFGIDIEPYSQTHFAVASQNEVSLYPNGSWVRDRLWWPTDPTAVSNPRDALSRVEYPNLPEPVLVFQTEVPVGGSQTEHYRAEITTESSLQLDLYRADIQQPSQVNLLVDKPSMGGGAAILGLSFVPTVGNMPIPGINGRLTLQQPVFVLGLTLLDPTGFGLFNLQWPGINLPTTDMVISGAAFPTSSSSVPAEFLNPTILQLQN